MPEQILPSYRSIPQCPKCGSVNLWLQCNATGCDFDISDKDVMEFLQSIPSYFILGLQAALAVVKGGDNIVAIDKLIREASPPDKHL